jgi:hypothetical protein
MMSVRFASCASLALTSLIGLYAQSDLATISPGSYELTAEKEGFRAFRETGIVLQVGQSLRSDIRLNIGSVKEAVSVSATVAPLNTEKSL